MRRWLLLLAILVVVAIPLIVFADNIYLPLVRIYPGPSSPTTASAPTAILGPTATPDAAGKRLTVPAGFHINIYAQGLSQPRLMTFGADGALYVSEMGAGRITRMVDANGDGRADANTVVATGLNTPHGLEWNGQWLYVAELGKVERLRDADGNGSLETRELVTDNIPGGGGHVTRTLHFGPDGMLYVSAGSSCNICVESDPRRAAIMRFNADGSIPADNPYATDADPRRQAVWASGLRNSVDFFFTASGDLWASFNGSDDLGDDVPPEVIVAVVRKGANYGWPYCYTPVLGLNGPSNPIAEVRDTRLALPSGFTCADAVPALFTDVAHSAPLGMTLGSGQLFPTAYRDDVFVAYHGSWNTTTANARDCKVERIVVQNGVPVSSETFANGWRAAGGVCGDSSGYGRPADVAFGPDGAMFISDDAGGRIYRVIYSP